MLKKTIKNTLLTVLLFGIFLLIDRFANNQGNPYFFFSMVVAVCSFLLLIASVVFLLLNVVFKTPNKDAHLFLIVFNVTQLLAVLALGWPLSWEETVSNKFVQSNAASIIIFVISLTVGQRRAKKLNS